MPLRKHWITHPVNVTGDPPANVSAFLAELEQLCVKHAVVIAHEDTYGAFVVEPITPIGLKWLVVDTHVSGKFYR